MSSVVLVIPGPLGQRTGGYLYDARMVDQLRARGWGVRVVALDGRFPDPDERARESMNAALTSIPDGSLVVVDGLAMEALTPGYEAHTDRLDLVLLMHHLISDEMGRSDASSPLRTLETSVLQGATGVVVTSPFTASRIESLGVPVDRIRVVEPGTTPAARYATGAPGDAPPRLLSVSSITPRKGHDTLVEALAQLDDLAWTCSFAGSLERDPAYVARIRDLVRSHGLVDRIAFLGECDEAHLEELYGEADLLVLASRFEGYGMALTEALAHGLPVVATTAGAIPYTVPPDAGRLVSPDDPAALARALREVLNDEGPSIRARLARGARRHACELPDWPESGARFESALLDFARSVNPLGQFSHDWLALREPVDGRSRDEGLARELDSYLDLARPVDPPIPEAHPCTILDLGAGTGAGPRWLASRLSCDQRWILVDQSAQALRQAESIPLETRPGVRARIEVREGDLAGPGLSALDEADAVTASALLDLVSDTWLSRLVRRVSDRRCPALFALSYDGTILWSDSDALDELVTRAVNEHQHRDKGLGPALGPTAADTARDLFLARGFRVLVADTPWHLGPEDAELAAALIDGWREAAVDVHPDRAAELGAWASRRVAAVRDRGVRLTVGHRDLLALPAP